jgi:hypothetical protein
MIFMLLLASVAVLEYITRRPVPEPEDTKKAANTTKAVHSSAGPASPPDLLPDVGLLALGKALEDQGCGAPPETLPAEHKVPADRV